MNATVFGTNSLGANMSGSTILIAVEYSRSENVSDTYELYIDGKLFDRPRVSNGNATRRPSLSVGRHTLRVVVSSTSSKTARFEITSTSSQHSFRVTSKRGLLGVSVKLFHFTPDMYDRDKEVK